MKKRISSTDVAREAGVSRATVSYILNNVEDIKIKPETKERVLQAARKLNYHPDSIARAMKTQRSMCIGVVSRRDVSEERFTKVLRGIKEVLSLHKYSILLCSEETDANAYPEFYNYYHQRKIDGVILISQIESIERSQVEKMVDLICKDSIPAVLADYHIANPMLNCIDINYFHGGYLAAEYLVGKGYTDYVYLAPRYETVQELERLRGVKAALNARGIGTDRLHIINVNPRPDEIGNIIKELLNQRGTAIIASWSHIALQTLYFANKAGLRIPEDIAVISLAGSGFADLSYPRLTTSDLPLQEIGKKSAEVLLDTLGKNSLPVNITLPCALNIRESV